MKIEQQRDKYKANTKKCEVESRTILRVKRNSKQKVKELQKLENKILAPKGDKIQYFREFDPGSG